MPRPATRSREAFPSTTPAPLSSTPVGSRLGLADSYFALGLSTRDDFNRIISLLAALVSLAVMVFFIMAVLDNGGRDTFISLARGCYVLLVIWYGYLGSGLMRRPDPDLWQ